MKRPTPTKKRSQTVPMIDPDVIVVGAGAAGLLCAGTAARRGLRVLLLEKNPRPARKVMITGKGRCNVTNHCSPQDFLLAVRRNARFLYSAIYGFSPEDTMALFEDLGIPLKTERGNRVFPVSDRAVDIVDALQRYALGENVSLQQGTAQALLLEDGCLKGVKTGDGRHLLAPQVVLATGGASYPRTGSTGDGYALARQAGHTVVPPTPSLIPIVTREDWCRDLMGLSLRNVTLTLADTRRNKVLFQELGEMLFTHFGISGPLVLSASCHMEQDRLRDYCLSIDLKPGLSAQQLDARLLRDFEAYHNRDFQNALGDLLPRKLIPVVVSLSGIPGQEKVHQITREQRQALVQLLKGLPVTPQAFRPLEEAIVTCGGVAVKEVNPRTMESKLCPGLYFAGELLDVDAYTGGYNLQIAFSTGHAAGMALAENTCV